MTTSETTSSSIQALLLDGAYVWQVHNCKLTKAQCVFDAPMPLLAHYQGLPESIQDTHPLDFAALQHLNTVMDTKTAADIVKIDAQFFQKSYQIKYIGRAVIFCPDLKIALRFYFTNTSKDTQTVFIQDKISAIQSQAVNWRAFGVVDVLYKGTTPIISQDQMTETVQIMPSVEYQPMPASHSLAVLYVLDEWRGQFAFLNTVIEQTVLDALR